MTDFYACCPVVNRPDLMDRVVSMVAPHLPCELVIIDNSPDGVFLDRYRSTGNVLVYRPPVPLTFSQSMNVEFEMARDAGAKYLLHMHSDAFIPQEAIPALIDYVGKIEAEGRRWAVCFTLYDVFCCYKVEAALDAGGYDTLFPDYFSDQVFWQRLKAKGYERAQADIEGVTHEGSATIRSDPKREFLNTEFLFPFYQQLYRRMYGGEPSKETYVVPFNRPDLWS